MTTLNKEAENIAYKLGDQFNQTLRESIKNTLINWRAKFLRDDIDRNYLSDIHFAQTITVQFEQVNLLTEFGADFSCISAICPNVAEQDEYKILKSKKRIPLPIRTKTAHIAPYSFIGSVEGTKGFVFTTLDRFPYLVGMKYQNNTIYYTVINGYLYIINNLNLCDINATLKLCNVMIRGVFEDPREAYKVCSVTDGFTDDAIFPIGVDMLMQLHAGIISGEYRLEPKDGKQVNIKPDDNG